MTSLLLVLAGGAVGAPLRFLVDRRMKAWRDDAMPWGTLAVNLLGSAVLGVTAGASAVAAWPGWVITAVGVGGCGALTTFSAFSLETVRLVEERRAGWAASYGLLTATGALSVCAAGWTLATWALG